MIKNTLKQTKFEDKTVKSTQLSLGSSWSSWFPDLSRPYGACVKRGSGKHNYVRSQSFLSESAVKNIHVGRKKDSNIPSPGRTRSVKCPTQGQQRQLNPDPMPCPPPASITLIGALFWYGLKGLFLQHKLVDKIVLDRKNWWRHKQYKRGGSSQALTGGSGGEWDKESIQYSNAMKINTRPLKCNYYFLMRPHVHSTSRVLVIWAQINIIEPCVLDITKKKKAITW